MQIPWGERSHGHVKAARFSFLPFHCRHQLVAGWRALCRFRFTAMLRVKVKLSPAYVKAKYKGKVLIQESLAYFFLRLFSPTYFHSDKGKKKKKKNLQ